MPQLLLIHALSPLHAGTGHAIGAVDLPIARDKATGFPYVPGSSIKGVLRDAAAVLGAERRTQIFGPERDRAGDHAGALMVGDANLLLMPARSLVGTFAWVTSPWLLRRFARDALEAGVKIPEVTDPETAERAVVAKDSALLSGDRVVFEDLDFVAKKETSIDDLGARLGSLLFPDTLPDANTWRALLRRRLCVLHDDAMSYFSEHGTDITTRIALDPDAKTVRSGSLWTEESLPTESVLASLVAAQRVGKTAPEATLAEVGKLVANPLQLGGDATVGRGRCRFVTAGAAR